MPQDDSLTRSPVGVIVRCWDTLRRDAQALSAFIECCHIFENHGGIIVLSLTETTASPVVLRDFFQKSIVIDKTILSPARLSRLTQCVYFFTGDRLHHVPCDFVYSSPESLRFGFIISNGFGLGHVVRMKTMARALADYGDIAFMSFSAGLRKSDIGPVFYLASAEYLKLHAREGLLYVKEGVKRFIEDFLPTHLFYDGNVLPLGMLAAIAERPEIHLTWIRRGMWPSNIDARYMVQQALVDLIIEPGDLADAYDTGPTYHGRNVFVQPRMFIKTLPICPQVLQMNQKEARQALGLPSEGRYVLLMLGVSQHMNMETLLIKASQEVCHSGMHPVIAHWPIAHEQSPQISNATVIDCMPIAPYYKAFDMIVSAAGYNNYHELLISGLPVIFMPQEDEGRDQQLARARYAADYGWAKLCRQQDVLSLHEHIEALSNKTYDLRPDFLLLKDWSPVIHALCNQRVSQTARDPVLPDVPDCNIIELIHILFIRYAKQKPALKVCFVFLSNSEELSALKKDRAQSDVRHIVITDSIDPIVLRRHRLDYLWLNRAWLMKPWAIMRQLLCWYHVWRPSELIYYNEGKMQYFYLSDVQSLKSGVNKRHKTHHVH